MMNGKKAVFLPSKIVFKVSQGTTSLNYNISGTNIVLKDKNDVVLSSVSQGYLPSISISQSTQDDVFTITADKLNLVSFQFNMSLTNILEFNIANKNTIISNCFNGCGNLLDARNISISESSDISSIFNSCMSLNHVDPFYIKHGVNAAAALSYTGLAYNPIINSEEIKNATNLFYNSQNFNDMASFQNKNLIWNEMVNFVNGTSVTIIENLYLPNVTYFNIYNSYNITSIKNINLPIANFIGFSYNSNLVEISDIYAPNVKNLNSSFYNLPLLSTINNLTTGSITSLNNAFSHCGALTTAPLLNIDSSLNNMSGMYAGCTSLVNIDNAVNMINNYNGTQKLNCTEMFLGCSSITQLPQLSYNKISNASSMFQRTGITSIANKIIEVENPSSMFNACINLVSINNLEFLNSKMSNGIFSNCSSLDNATIVFTTTADYTDTSSIFTSCTNLRNCSLTITSSSSTPIILSSTFVNCQLLLNVNIVITNGQACNASAMFYNCTSLQSIPSMDYSKLINTYQMFYNCNAISSIGSLNLDNSNDVALMFSDCSGIQSVASCIIPKATTLSYMFNNCYNLTSIGSISANSAYDASGVFSGCGKLVSTGNIDINSATNVSNIFYGCAELITTTLSVINATTFMSSFYNCYKLASISLNSVKANNYSSCFYGCSELISATLSTPDQSVNSITTSSMFKNCIKLSTTNIDLSKVTDSYEMFYNCAQFNSTIEDIVFSNYNGYRMFYGSGITGANNITMNIQGYTNISEVFSNCQNLTYATNINIIAQENSAADASYFFGSSINLSDITGLNIVGNVTCRFLLSNTGIVNLNLSLPNINQNSICDYFVANSSNLLSITNLEIGGYAETLINLCPNLLSIDTIKINSNVGSGRSPIIDNCNSLTDVDEIYSNWSNAINLRGGNSLSSINKLHIPNCTSIKLEYQSIQSMNEIVGSNLTSLDSFAYNTSLSNFPIINTSNCTNFYMAFRNSKVTTYNSNYNLSRSTVLQFMFANCTELTSVIINDNFINSPLCDGMFMNCNKLTHVTFSNAAGLRTNSAPYSLFTEDSMVTDLVIPNFTCSMYIPPLITDISKLESIINGAGSPINQYDNIITLGTSRLNSLSTNVKNNAISKGWILQ